MNSTTAAQQFREAEERYSARRFPEALELLDELSRKIPLHEAVEFARAQTLVMMGRASEAQTVCENLLPLFGAEGIGELSKVLRDLQQSGDEEIEWGFLRPTEDPVSFDMLDSENEPESPASMADDIDSFFAELDDSTVQGLDEIEVIGAPGQHAVSAEDTTDPQEPPSSSESDPLAEPAGSTAENELLSAFDTAGEPPGPESRPEPDAEVVPLSAFSEDTNPLGSLGSFDDVDMPPEAPAAAAPERSAASEGPSELDELGPLSSLEDDTPEFEPPPVKQHDFGDDFGALGALEDLDEPEPVQHTANFPPVDDTSSDIELGGLSDFGSDDSEPGVAAEVELQQPPSVWEDAVSNVPAPPPFDPVHLETPLSGGFDVTEETTATPSMFDEPAPPPPPASTRAEQPERRSRGGMVVLLLVLVAAGGGGAWYYLHSQQADTPEVARSADPATPATAMPAPTAAPATRAIDGDEFGQMLATLTPDGDPQPLITALGGIADFSEWPREEQPALAMVVRASGDRAGSGVTTAFTELARFLVDAGADPSFLDRRGQSLVEMAAQANDEAMVRLLVDRGGGVSPKVLVWAVRSGRLPLVQQFLDSHPDAASAEVLYAAIDARHEAIADVLLKHGVPLDSVIGLAVQRGTRHVFRYAVEGGVDIAAHPELLPLAIESQQPAMVELLLQSGADPRPTAAALEAKEQKTPEDQEMLRLIREQLAVRPAAPTSPNASPVAEAPPVDLGMLYARAKQGEADWALVGAWRGGMQSASDRVYRISIDADRPEDLAPLAQLRPGDLHALRLEGAGVTDEALQYVGALSGLRELELIGARVTDAGLQRLNHLTLLTSLRVSSPPDGPRAQINGPGLTILRPMLHLTELDVSGTTFGDRALPLLDGMTGLKSLNVAGTEITDGSLGSLRNLRNLTVLAFGTGPGMSSKITGSALYAVRDLENLRELHLYGVPMSKIGFEALASLRRLSYIDLRATGISAEDVPQLSALKHVGTLRLGENDLEQQARTDLQKQLSGSTLDFGA